MSGQVKILGYGRNVYQSPLSPETLPKLRPEFLATERVFYDYELYGFNGGRLEDVEVEAKLRFIVVPPMQASDYFEQLQILMLQAMAWFFIGKGDKEIKWEKPLENQKDSISQRFAELCLEKNQQGPARFGDPNHLIRHLRDMFQNYVFRRTKRGEGSEIYFCLMPDEEVNHSKDEEELD